MLEVLRENIGVPSCQHVLVVAPHGRGKTMLLARVAAELHADAVLAEHLLPVRFMEESQEIFTPADFWLETLFHLARESAVYDPKVAREVRETHADLTGRWGEETLGERALAAVLWAADRLGRQLVLMVENLQALCDTVDADFGWKLREVLQSEPRIMLLATATSRFQELDNAREPFFELFRPVELAHVVHGRVPRTVARHQRRRRERTRDAAAGDPDRRQPPPPGHGCRMGAALVCTPVDGSAGDVD